jgi:L-threonylcarbamoyladenylate synthase
MVDTKIMNELLLSKDLKKITTAFDVGKIICLPTDTVYAISCDATNRESIERIYSIKGRDFHKPLSIFVADMDMAAKYVEFSEGAVLVAKKFWPGPLTIIAQKTQNITMPPQIIKNGELAIRVPDDCLIQKICTAIGKPIIATSANISSKPNINLVNDIRTEFGDKVDLIIDSDNAKQNQSLIPSTIVRLNNDNSFEVIREGRLSIKKLLKELKKPVL